ncbi:NADH:flavin oxidoreductase [Phenylobacterium sp. Root77]|uniref:NADH:flavin oxidoreductase n=1 Tax=unclassified Phenylobacterium TaxID=2640670 RepID=UPI0006FDCAD7|nr:MULTISPECIES: NADH:flavin oxidoreductase [unclassified Phenylobacterium]KQW69328.1 NADH:flavin oxidoreductase [Phenylobacterium sp. Root1277]KQW95306.1 NADH:flavin oxidoreductase [Phenylobacterium sp. Root1290]KRC41097.1 NADH:flavin oxidoreductase [Phenylobacterium sp. Root77]
MTDLFAPLSFKHGPGMKNRFMLAPLTNTQSHPDGTLSDDEFAWLTYRAEGGFGLTMTCAAHVQAIGQGFPGQLGVFGDQHLPGLTRLAAAIKAQGSVAALQLHHAGNRSPKELIGEAPVCPSADEETGARALTLAEVEQLRDDFIAAAVRSEKAGFDGVEIHGAHGYVLCQFLSPALNRREDRYGGSPENRARLILEIIDGIRARCGKDFTLGIRLSPERFGLELAEIVALARQILADGKIDYLDMSLWDVAKEPVEDAFKGRTLMSYFTELERGEVRLGVAGKIMTAAVARECLENGADYVLIGRAAILHHDFPQKIAADPDFVSVPLPVTREYLRQERLSPVFVDYMNNWKGFVAQEETV